MSTHLLSRGQVLLRQARPSHSTLKRTAVLTKLANAKSTVRPLIESYQRGLSSRAVTKSLLNTHITVRNYSGRDARRQARQAPQVQVKDREHTAYNSDVVPVQQRPPPTYERPEEEQKSQWGNQEIYRDPNVTSEQLITPGVLAHVRKVYTLVGAAAGAAALGGTGAVLAGVGGGLAMMMSLGALVPLISALFLNPSKVLLRQNLLLGAAAMMGIGAAPLLGLASMPAILMALGGTGAIFAGFSLIALKAPSGTYLKVGGVMMGGALVILLAALLSMFGGALGIPAGILAGLHSINLYGGLLLLSLFVAYDTQQMIDRAASGDTDHVSDAINMFIDVWGIFIRLLAIFGRDD